LFALLPMTEPEFASITNDGFWPFATCRLHRAMSEFEAKPEIICLHTSTNGSMAPPVVAQAAAEQHPWPSGQPRSRGAALTGA
jgi:hypothetical protein